MGSGSGWHVGGVGGNCREETGGNRLGESGTKERIWYSDIKMEDFILRRPEELGL